MAKNLVDALEEASKPPKGPNHPCTMVNNCVRCGCGGQVMVDASLHPLVDLGVGFRGGKFRVDKVYDMKRTIGYRGQCLKCNKAGNFFLPGHMPPNQETK